MWIIFLKRLCDGKVMLKVFIFLLRNYVMIIILKDPLCNLKLSLLIISKLVGSWQTQECGKLLIFQNSETEKVIIHSTNFFSLGFYMWLCRVYFREKIFKNICNVYSFVLDIIISEHIMPSSKKDAVVLSLPRSTIFFQLSVFLQVILLNIFCSLFSSGE